MEDNYIDKNTTNKAWQAMRKKLDQEMPVEYSKPRLLVWPFATLVCILLAGAVMVLCWPIDEEILESVNENTVEKSTSTIASTSVTSILKKDKSTSENLNSSNILINDRKKLFTTNEESVTLTEPNQQRTDEMFYSTSKVNIPASKIVRKSTLQSTKSNFSRMESPIIDEDRLGKKLNLSKRNSGVSIEQKMVYKSAGISVSREKVVEKELPQDVEKREISKQKGDAVLILNSLTLFVEPNSEEIDVNANIFHSLPTVQKLNKEWTFGVSIYGTQHLGNIGRLFRGSITSKSIGVDLVSLKRINLNWQFGIGLGYQSVGVFTSDKDRVKLNCACTLSEDTAQGGFDLSLNSISTSRKNDSFVNPYFTYSPSHFISLPIFVERTLNSHWAITGGVRYDHKLGNFNKDSYSGIRKSSFDFFITPTYKLTRHLSLGLIVQHSTRRLKNDLSELGRNQIGLATRVHF